MGYTSPSREATGSIDEHDVAERDIRQEESVLQEPVDYPDDNACDSPDLDQDYGYVEADYGDPRLPDDRYEHGNREHAGHVEEDDAEEAEEADEEGYDDDNCMDTDSAAWDETHDSYAHDGHSKTNGTTNMPSSCYVTTATIGFGDYPVPSPPRSIAGDPEMALMRVSPYYTFARARRD